MSGELLIFFIFFASAVDQNCMNWFVDSKTKKDDKCILKCTSLSVDMSTFSCPNFCDKLCNLSPSKKIIFQISDLYPGLTSEERAIATQYPVQSLKAYQLSWEAETICLKEYPTSRTNDESDACRHYVWAALLFRDLGKDITDKILNAHEQEPRQPETEKAMDLANNRRGLLIAERLVINTKFSEKSLMSSFRDDLKQGRLIVLKRHNKGSSR